MHVVGPWLLALAAGPGAAGERVLTLDPAHTEIRFEVGATLHTVRGGADLTRGEIRFGDRPGTAPATGAVVVDARSARTGNERRDRNMRDRVLESERFPEIVFRPERVDVKALAPPRAELTLFGQIEIHGASHPLAIPADLVATEPDRLHIHAHFSIPYVSWGMKDVSNVILRVDDTVVVEIDAEGTLAPGSH